MNWDTRGQSLVPAPFYSGSRDELTYVPANKRIAIIVRVFNNYMKGAKIYKEEIVWEIYLKCNLKLSEKE